MTAGEFKVQFGALDSVAADVQGSANQIRGRLDRLDSELAPPRSDWTGAASEAYQQAKTEWTKAITSMQQLLTQIGSAVSTSNTEYQSAERTNRARW
jgi:early secretory antigenic target protein ESAT-6